ncbi:hypothetical protein Taro_044071 [Colocasia esculenta]|uniref:Uncharacterized protein n=1 Tax=Colocasia esculenta TaxID=4460 RepID=A0A843WTM2_COLES|nr:hypothetical protein [Colocasia esculenta]
MASEAGQQMVKLGLMGQKSLAGDEPNLASTITCGALLVGGTDTSSRHWSPTSPFPVPHSRVLRPETLEVPGMDLRLCVRRSGA